jgi:cytochrome c553
MDSEQQLKPATSENLQMAGNSSIRQQIHRNAVALIGLLLLCPAASASQDIQAQISECEACHGPGGASVEDDVPGLAGMDADTLLKAMEEFSYYERHCTTTTYRSGDRPKTPLNMCNVANTLNDQERQQLAEYFEAR